MLPIPFADTIIIRPWHDPVVEAVGFEARSHVGPQVDAQDALWQAPLSGRWLHLAIFSRGENQPLSEARANRISTFISDPLLFVTSDTPHNQIEASSGLSENCPKIDGSTRVR